MSDGAERSNFPPEQISFNLEDINLEQRWTGYIGDIGDDSFEVTLTDLLGEEEFTTIDKSQVSEQDQQYIAKDAQFEWTLGHVDVNGRRIGVSIIEFTPPQTKSDEERQEALQAGQEMSKALLARESRRTT
jgi:hypothetical protein